jgi:protocatechuate 3,4-dioxygenase beta subunit
MERKDFLRNSLGIIGAGTIVAACSKSSPSSGSSSSGSGTGTGTGSSGSCVASPNEVEGPYPYPGGEINNPLQRVDITGGQTGLPLSLTLTVVNVNQSCAVVQNARVDIWYCNKDGYYSGYANQPGILGTQSYLGQTWLRGYQLSDASGQVKFTGIYPGWYSGRATHIHVEVFVNNTLVKTTQMAFPETISDAVHVTSLYASHGINTTRNANDNIFGNSATDLANQMLSLTGNTTSGYTGTYTIGIAI